MSPGEGGRPPALNMYSPLSEIVRREPVTIPLQATVRQALERMEQARVGSIVVADPQARVPLGIFTLQDLVRRVTLPGGELDEPIACVMTSGLISLRREASAHQAALMMARHGVRHVVVVDGEGTLAGIVSQNDLFALQRVGVKEVSGQIQSAGDLAGLRAAAFGIRTLTEGLMAQGVSVETLTHFVSTLNDLLTIRVIELTADQFDLPPVPMCWIALGSEGRLEQTFSTDQDNGIIFEADEADAPLVRGALLPFARAVNQTLDACGFTLCRGNIMAGNPEWCLTLAGWKRTFSRWIQEPQPQALRHATIFFDFRPVWGNAALAERLREWLLGAVAARPIFLRQMAENALQARPPLGAFGRLVCDRSREHPHTIDLKMAGSLIFADAARILGLARGVAHTSTAQRLRGAAERGVFGPESLAALVDGFHFIHLLRLRSQAGPGARRGLENRVDPRRLNELDRHVLKEAFRQGGRLQARLVTEYQLQA
jgi:CBS domain-containing protein